MREYLDDVYWDNDSQSFLLWKTRAFRGPHPQLGSFETVVKHLKTLRVLNVLNVKWRHFSYLLSENVSDCPGGHLCGIVSLCVMLYG